MKMLKMFLLMMGVLSFTTAKSFAQINAEDLTVQINKEAKKLEVIKKSDGTNVTASLKLVKANIDIFEKGGDYAGSLELKDWTVPLDEFSPNEIVKIAVISFTVINGGQTIELKDIRLAF
jgi:hypothetical protein